MHNIEKHRSGNAARPVLRSTLKEHRGDYFVTYGPASEHVPLAMIGLTFPAPNPDLARVREAMQRELHYWLKRYAVPALVTAFDATDSVLRLTDESDASHLRGFLNRPTEEVISRWALLRDDELPNDQKGEEYLRRVYADIPCRYRDEVRDKARRDVRQQGRSVRIIVLLVVGFPFAIEVVALGIDWLGHVLAGISIAAGIWKLARVMGWRKRSKREQEEEESEARMRHCYYHCERNPEAFARLRTENFEKEMIEANKREAARLKRLSEPN